MWLYDSVWRYKEGCTILEMGIIDEPSPDNQKSMGISIAMENENQMMAAYLILSRKESLEMARRIIEVFEGGGE